MLVFGPPVSATAEALGSTSGAMARWQAASENTTAAETTARRVRPWRDLIVRS